jgi:hypothetical protein
LAKNNIIAAASTGGFIAHLQFEYGALNLSKAKTAAKLPIPSYPSMRQIDLPPIPG